MRSPGRRIEWALVALITLAAAALRLASIGKVAPDPFYDAAVRSMTLSWHNFFFGAFEPAASVSIDKPPVDLWLQVISVKLFGFSITTLKLPEIAGGTLSVPLLYMAVKRMWSAPAGIAAAAAMAVLPVEVITARSDTMDALMMMLLVLALLLAVRAAETGRTRWLVAAAAALGVAFDVKLLESIVALPGLAAFAYLAVPGSRLKRVSRVALAGAVYVVVALSWLTATLLVPAHDRPYAIGSTNGSAWNAAFVFNGTDRLGGKSVEPGTTVYEPGHRYPEATQAERDHIPIVSPSPTRLLARIGPLSGERLGLEVLMGLLLGIPAFLWGWRADARDADRRELDKREPDARDTDSREPDRDDGEREDEARAAARLRMRRAAAVGLGLWMLAGIVLFSHMIRLHPRYVEGFTPAVAAMLGIGVAWAASPPLRGAASRSRAASAGASPPPVSPDSSERRYSTARLAVLAVSLVVGVYYCERLLYGYPPEWWVCLGAAVVAIALASVMRFAPGSPRLRALLPAAVMTMTLVSILAVPVKADITAIRDHVSDANAVGQLPPEQQHVVSAYLLAHQHGSFYEMAAESATAVGALIVQDARPVLMLTTYDGRVFTPIAKLKRLIAEGKVRYAFLNTFCTPVARSIDPACSAPVEWVRAHGKDVSFKAGLKSGGVLYLLPGATP